MVLTTYGSALIPMGLKLDDRRGILLDGALADLADVHEVSEVLVVIEGIADDKVVRHLEAHVVGAEAIAQRGLLAYQGRDLEKN